VELEVVLVVLLAEEVGMLVGMGFEMGSQNQISLGKVSA